MKKLIAALMLGTLAMVPAYGQAPVAPASLDATADAEALVRELLPDAAMIQVATGAFDYGLNNEIAADTEAAKAYAANPKMKAFVADRLRTSFLTVMKGRLPALRAEIGGIILTEMTGQEIADTLTFFRSPVGQKIKAQVYQSMGDKPEQDQEAMRQAAIASVMANLAPEDFPALMAFGNSGAAQKMNEVNPKIAAVSKAWAEKMVAENEGMLKAQAAAAAADYLAKNK